MSDQSPIPAPAAANTFERIKRTSEEGNESWSARDLARVLEYSVFRHFQPVIEKAKDACLKSGHSVADHFAEMRKMVNIGSGAQREDWALSRYACYLVIQKQTGRFHSRATRRGRQVTFRNRQRRAAQRPTGEEKSRAGHR